MDHYYLHVNTHNDHQPTELLRTFEVHLFSEGHFLVNHPFLTVWQVMLKQTEPPSFVCASPRIGMHSHPTPTGFIREFIQVRPMSAAHRLAFFQAVAAHPAAAEVEELQARLDQAITHERDVVRLEARCRNALGQALSNTEVRRLDARLTTDWESLYQRLLAAIAAFDLPAAAAEQLRVALLPEGPATLIRMPMFDRQSRVQELIDRVLSNETLFDAVSDLGLLPMLNRIAQLSISLGLAIARARCHAPLGETGQANDRGQDNVAVVVASICGQYPGNSRSDIDARRALLAPLLHE